MRATPFLAGGLGGGVGVAMADEGGEFGVEEDAVVLGSRYASLASWNVKSAVKMTISRPFRSSMSNLAAYTRHQHQRHTRRRRSGWAHAPMEVVIQDLDRRRSDPSRGFFCHRDQHGWVRFSDDEAFFAFPLKLVAA